MQTAPTLSAAHQINPALLRVAQPDGTWLVYEPGDTLPAQPPAPPPSRILSVQDFRSRFTDPELAAVVSSADVSVKVLLVKLQTRADVDLNDPQIAAGLDLLVSKGLLTAARRSVIGA